MVRKNSFLLLYLEYKAYCIHNVDLILFVYNFTVRKNAFLLLYLDYKAY